MASEKKFLHKALDDSVVIEYLSKSLDRAGVSSISVQRTPIATRITMLVQKPGMVVGKRGAGINDIVEDIKAKFGIDNPQIEVLEVPIPSLDSKLVAQKIGKQIELRGNVKQVMRMSLQDIMGAGALGAEIRVAGKIVGKGGKAKTISARQGFLKKSGESKRLVSVGRYTAYPKAGAIGVTVRILPSGVYMAEKIDVSKLKLPEAAVAPTAPVEAVAQDSLQAKIEMEKKPVQKATEAEGEEAKPKKVSRKKAAAAKPLDETASAVAAKPSTEGTAPAAENAPVPSAQ